MGRAGSLAPLLFGTECTSMQHPSTPDAPDLFISHFGYPPSQVASAPGRVEVLGNHTDYNGGTVVGAGISLRLEVAAEVRTDSSIRLVSNGSGIQSGIVTTSVETYASDDLPEWTRYPLGVLDEFRMQGLWENEGLDLAVDSMLPVGMGLSSSAAIELSTAGVLSALRQRPDSACGTESTEPGNPPTSRPQLGTEVLVGIAHRAENRYVGVPCGLLDQTVVGHAKKDSLVVLDASTNRHMAVALPAGLSFVVFRTHISHRLIDSPYETRHRECRNALMGLQRMMPGTRHLARLHPADIVAYEVVLDPVLVRRARHVVEEQRRVGRFLRALVEGDVAAAGQLMRESHESSRVLFENSTPELDILVDRLMEKTGVLGARLSGAGWGGAVMALVNESFEDDAAESVCDAYEELFEARPHWWQTDAEEGLRVRTHRIA